MFRVCAGISGACADRGLDLFFHTPQDVRFASPDEYVHSILERGCDGVVCVGHVRSEIIERLTEHLPTVLVAGAGRAFGGPVPRLVADQALASAAGARHLISLGRSRIALLGMRNSDFSPPDAIAARFREVLEEAGIDYDESLLSFTSPAVPEEFRLGRGANSGYWFDARLFSGPEHPDGVVAINPGLATNFYEFALERGILIGRDVSVVCVMDTHWTESVRPRCTSVDFLSEELGRQALEMLEEAIEGRIGPDELRIGATPVIVRESCGAPEEMRSPARSNAVEVLR